MANGRKISYPTCPYCKGALTSRLCDYSSISLADLAVGRRSEPVRIKCACGETYYVSCTIRFYASKK